MTSWRRVFVHLVWSTWDRRPQLDFAREAVAYGTFARQALRLRCELLAVGGVADHVHLLVSLHSATALSTLVRAMKSASTVEVRRTLQRDDEFRWQHRYAALSVRAEDVSPVSDYIRSQKQHHGGGTIEHGWEPRLDDLNDEDD